VAKRKKSKCEDWLRNQHPGQSLSDVISAAGWQHAGRWAFDGYNWQEGTVHHDGQGSAAFLHGSQPMKLTSQETKFLTALLREQNQTGCRGPAHDLLRKHAYPDAPLTGRNSLAFAYDVVPLTMLLVGDFGDFGAIDNFARNGPLVKEVDWPWSSAEEFRRRLEDARVEWQARRTAVSERGQRVGVGRQSDS
jgi:hypothetical protein